MNACRDVRLKLSAYLDVELDAAERARVASHLSECGECRGLEADLKHVDRFLAPESEPLQAVAVSNPAQASVVTMKVRFTSDFPSISGSCCRVRRDPG